ncbi:hypothetical protein BC832DRAFT_594805 [Gaertneriomyces semiglobifer]|nr:hypothetical protein BC832DRAFT_594805 [Gaertneriomyces semiglobifer]
MWPHATLCHTFRIKKFVEVTSANPDYWFEADSVALQNAPHMQFLLSFGMDASESYGAWISPLTTPIFLTKVVFSIVEMNGHQPSSYVIRRCQVNEDEQVGTSHLACLEDLKKNEETKLKVEIWMDNVPPGNASSSEMNLEEQTPKDACMDVEEEDTDTQVKSPKSCWPFGVLLSRPDTADVHISLGPDGSKLPHIDALEPLRRSRRRQVRDNSTDSDEETRDAFMFTHRAILLAQSQYFDAMLKGGYRESQQSSTTDRATIAIKGPFCRSSLSNVLSSYLSYLYTGTLTGCPLNSNKLRVQLFALAHLTAVSPLCFELVTEISKHITIDNVCGILVFAYLYDDDPDESEGNGDDHGPARKLKRIVVKKMMTSGWKKRLKLRKDFKNMMIDEANSHILQDLMRAGWYGRT